VRSRIQGFFDFDGDTVGAAFDARVEKFASTVAVVELHQNAKTNEHSAELVDTLTRQLRAGASS
jgi:hypothetical protein